MGIKGKIKFTAFKLHSKNVEVLENKQSQMQTLVTLTIVKLYLTVFEGISQYLKIFEGANKMTQPDLILKLVEMLLAERDKNNNLQSQLEEHKKSKE